METGATEPFDRLGEETEARAQERAQVGTFALQGVAGSEEAPPLSPSQPVQPRPWGPRGDGWLCSGPDHVASVLELQAPVPHAPVLAMQSPELGRQQGLPGHRCTVRDPMGFSQWGALGRPKDEAQPTPSLVPVASSPLPGLGFLTCQTPPHTLRDVAP